VARRSRIEALVGDALDILPALGIPLEGMAERRKIRMAKAFLSVSGMKPGMGWSEARPDNRLRSRDVIRWMNEFLGESISSGSYDDIRRKDLLLPVEAGLVLKSAGKQGAATNDGTRSYALSPETAVLLHAYGTPAWDASLSAFLGGREMLADQLKKRRLQERIPVTIGSETLQFGPGEHNALQKAIIEDFLPRFGFGAEVLYVGDTEDKLLFCKSEQLLDLGFFELSHDKLPDVLAFSARKKWLFLIEAVYSANPITEMRKRTLDQLTKACAADIIYVSAFLSRAAFRKFVAEIAWETEVWIAESPDHLIHFNGDKFLGPHVSRS
jgi:type II restriction enzyme